MEIRKLEKRENLRTRPLYEEAFPEDRGAFADYYYAYVAPRSTVYAVCDGDVIQSMVHLNPYELSWNGERITIPYLVAVATRERMRGRGLMRSLLERIFRDLDEEKVPFAFLMPVDEAIYRPFGFVRTWSWQWEEDVIRNLAGDGAQERDSITAGGVSCSAAEDCRCMRGEMPAEDGLRRHGGTPADSGRDHPDMVRAAELSDEELAGLADSVNRLLGGSFELFTLRSAAYYRRLQREQAASGGELMIRMRDGQPEAAVQTRGRTIRR